MTSNGDKVECDENTLDLIELKWQINCIFKLIKKYDTSQYAKSLSKCDKLKQLGNEALRKRKLHLALAYYNQALKLCPNNKCETSNGDARHSSVSQIAPSNELYSFLIANRALVLFQMGKYGDCLEEINLALESGYPSAMRDKLYKRKASCQMALEETGELNTAQGYLKSEPPAHNNVTRGAKNTQSTNRRQLANGKCRLLSVSNDDKLSSPSSAQHKDAANTFIHPTLRIYRDDEKDGERTVRTVKSIDESHLLINEPAYTWILHSKYFADHCYNCLKYMSSEQVRQDDFDEDAEKHLPQDVNINYHLIPCFNCNQVVFCSIKCRDSAWKHFHSTECTYVSLIEKVDDGMYSPFMTLRVVLRQSLRSVISELDRSQEKEVRSKSRKRSSSRKRSKDLQIVSLDEMCKLKYDNFRQLIYHPAQADAVCLEKATFIVTFLLYRSEYPMKHGSKTTTIGPIDQLSDATSMQLLNNLLRFRSLLSEHIRRCQVNSMHITHRKLDYSSSNLPDNLIDLTPHLMEYKIGCGLFLSTAMINHSCDPNSKCCKFDGARVCLISNKQITCSTDITISYGLFYKYHTFQYRQSELLNNYYFNCSCNACINRMEPIFNAFKCNKCSGAVIEVDKCHPADQAANGTESVQTSPPNDDNEIICAKNECDSKSVEKRRVSKVDERKVHFNEKQLSEAVEARARRGSQSKKMFICVECRSCNHLQMRKLTNCLNQGNKLLSEALSIIYSENIDDELLTRAVERLADALQVLESVLHESHMQITIILDYIVAILKKVKKYPDAIEYGKRLLSIVERHFDEDVNLFNNQFKLLDIYRHHLLQTAAGKDESIQIKCSKDDSRLLLSKFSNKMLTLLSDDSVELDFYDKYITSFRQLLTIGADKFTEH